MPAHVAIVGAGPAGLNAALEARRRGCRVTLIDEGAKPGGQIFRQSAVGSGLRVGVSSELKRKTDLLNRFSVIEDQLDYRSGHTAYALFEGPELHISDNQSSEVLKPEVVVIATGVCERVVPFPGWTLPGVVYAGGAQALLKSQAVRIGEKILIAGAGPLPLVVAAQMINAGADVTAVATLHPLLGLLTRPFALWAGRQVVFEGLQYWKTLRRHRVPVLSRMVPARAEGGEQVESVLLVQHDGTGRPLPGTEKRLECDILAVNYGFTANSELATMAGAAVEYKPGQGGWLPVTDRWCRTSVSGVLVAGDAACLRGAWAAEADGCIAGAVAASYYDQRALNRIRDELKPFIQARVRHESFQRAVQDSLRLPNGVWGWADDDTIVCRCECVTHGRILEAIGEGHNSLNGIKKNTRAGMGWCGGRMCMQNVAACMRAGRTSPDLAPMTPRPLARPVSLRALNDQKNA